MDYREVLEKALKQKLDEEERPVDEKRVEEDMKSYHSMLSDKEKEIVQKLAGDMSALIDAHNESIKAQMDNIVHSKDYLSKCVYLMFGDFIKDAQRVVLSLLHTEDYGVRTICEECQRNGVSFEQFYGENMKKAFFNKMVETFLKSV